MPSQRRVRVVFMTAALIFFGLLYLSVSSSIASGNDAVRPADAY